jgi:hypothetical protein
MLDAMGKGVAPEPAKPASGGIAGLTMDKLWELEQRWLDDRD